MKKGLVSVTYRKLTAEEIIRLAVDCGLETIEWGGDIHVPLGDLETARKVGGLTRANGLSVASYGSYCRMTDNRSLEDAVATARALGAPLIRIWAGMLDSAASDGENRRTVIRQAQKLADMAGDLDIAFEYHMGTLTDTAESARALLEAVDRGNVGCLWQPPVGMTPEKCVEGIRMVAPYIRNIHVFSWTADQRYPLAWAEKQWKMYIGEIEKLPGEHSMLLEFVRDDDPGQLAVDAKCLDRWLKGEFEA